ncbi:MAG: PmoA family protein [Tannerellaceae bacterium]|jgi:hypothetical protein|nr:PmoA family protein [Tannerellaceae bacterium]
MKSLFSLLIASATLWSACTTREISLTLQAGETNRTDCVVSADISALKPTASSVITLYEWIDQGKTRQELPSQYAPEEGEPPTLYWILNGETPAGSVRRFVAVIKELPPGTAPDRKQAMDLVDTQKTLRLTKAGQAVLEYHYAHLDAPQGVDPAFGRSGFIHPAYSPAGHVLTQIQPQDHRHHFGIWNPWTRLIYEGQSYDLWNLGDKTGSVRARSIDQIFRGDVFCGYTATLEHYILKPQEEEQKVLNESWKVKAWNVPEGFLWDFESHLFPSTPQPVLLQAYRYAGFGYRARAEWTKDNCEMYTSEGKTRPHIDGTTARWIYITGDTPGGRSGLLFMGHPNNYNAPEPLRIWDENANGGRGDAFINFAPTKNKDWELQPGGHYILKYRILAYEGEMTPEQADRLWQDFAHSPKVIAQK